MTWAPQDTGATNKPGMPAFAQAYARWVNGNGGLGGRKLNVLTCNDHNDRVGAAKCARRAVNEKAVAVVGSYSQHADSFLPVLEGAGIPYIGGYGITNTEFTSPLSYPVNGGQPALLAGLGSALADSCGPVTLVRPDTIAGDQLPVLLDSGLTSGGHEPALDQRAAEDATEYGGQAERALERAADGTGTPGAWSPSSATAPAPSWTPSGGPARTIPTYGPRPCSAASTRPRSTRAAGRPAPTRGVRHQLVPGGGRPGLEHDEEGDQRGGVRRQRHRRGGRRGADDLDRVHRPEEGRGIARRRRGERRYRPAGARRRSGGRHGRAHPDPEVDLRRQAGLGRLPRLVNADVTLQVVREGRLVSARQGTTDTTRTLQNADVA